MSHPQSEVTRLTKVIALQYQHEVPEGSNSVEFTLFVNGIADGLERKSSARLGHSYTKGRELGQSY